MNRLRTVASVAALALLAFSGVACKQGLGERCELNSDCGDGLKCGSAGADNTTMADSGNRCVPIAAQAPVDAAVVDTGGGNDDVATTSDATTSDTATDQAMTTDTATGDAPVDTSSSDAAAGSDTGATTDASPDASDDASTSG